MSKHGKSQLLGKTKTSFSLQRWRKISITCMEDHLALNPRRSRRGNQSKPPPPSLEAGKYTIILGWHLPFPPPPKKGNQSLNGPKLFNSVERISKLNQNIYQIIYVPMTALWAVFEGRIDGLFPQATPGKCLQLRMHSKMKLRIT